MAHPSLGDLSQFNTILDNATGTAIWAESILAGGTPPAAARLTDGAIVEGADVSSAQFPPIKDRHPRLGELYVHNVIEPFPSSKKERCLFQITLRSCKLFHG